MPNKPEELWITNISQVKDIRISDLGITIIHGQSINLLAINKKGRSRYCVNRDQIDKSLTSGDIYKKQNIIKIRKVPPVVFNTKLESSDFLDSSSFRTKRKYAEIETPNYPDLDIEDGLEEEFAAENAELEFADRAPILPVDPKFKHMQVEE
jgi:hypothetical protein